jgi:histidine triad (HIT) family protein
MECIFCKIGKKEIQAKIVYETEYALGILDIHPCAPGHVIYFPKNHVHSILDVEKEFGEPLFIDIQSITAILKEKLFPEGFTIGINHGEVAGQEIAHLHIHIIPRWKNDGGSCIQSIVQNVSKKSLDDIYKQIIS